MRLSALTLAALASVVSGGCGDPSRGDLLRDWERAVADAVGAVPTEPPSVAAVRLPDRRERVLEVSDMRIGWTEYVSIQGCRWGPLVSQRNSQLGKVMPRTRLLIYEIDFLAAADACLDEMSEERRGRFEEAVLTKRRELGRHVWNAVWAGPEIERFLSPSLRLGFGESVASAEAVSRLEAAVAVDFRSAADGEALEAALGEMFRATRAGPLLRDLDRARHALESVAEHLERLPPDGCDARSDRLVQLFQERYVPVVQPVLGEIDRDARPLLEQLDTIFERTRRLSGESVAALDGFHDRVLDDEGDGGLGPRFRAASRRHAAAWEPALAACGGER